MRNSFFKYAVLLFSIVFIISNYTCKKVTTEPKDEESEINIRVLTENILDNSGSYDFGNVTVGETSTAVAFTIENLGTETLNLSSIPIVKISGTDSSMFTVTLQPSASITEGSSSNFSITFSPTAEGNKTATVSIPNNDADENPYSFTLNGTGAQVVSTVIEVAQMFQTIKSVPNTSAVLFVGPIEQNTVLKENDIDENSPVQITVPNVDGTYYVFIIDNEPKKLFRHDVQFGWFRLEDQQYQLSDSNYLVTIFRPGINPNQYTLVSEFIIEGTKYYLVEGEGGPNIQNYDHKDEFNWDNLGKIDYQANIYGNFESAYSPKRSPMKLALVSDGGDKHGIEDGVWNIGAIARELCDYNAEPMQSYLEENDFDVYRTSQYWGNDHPYFKNGNQFLAKVEEYGNFLRDLGKPDYGCDEFFIYVTAHSTGDAFNVYKPDGSGNFTIVAYGELYKKLLEFPEYVKVSIFFDGCYSGCAISHFKEPIKKLCDHLCALTILTSTDAENSAFSPSIGWDSGTQDFMQGADKKHDRDNKVGDIQDRYIEMEIQGSGSGTNPQFHHCPEGQSWCSLDGPTYCESQEHLYNLMGFFSHYFVEEPCSAVELPPDDRTVTNSWGLIKDIMYSMVNTYGKGIIRKDIPPWLLYTIAFDYPFNDQGIYVGPSPHNYKLNGSNILYSSDVYIILFNVMHDDIPIADPVYYYQYGFVFDRDGNTNNNYQPHPDYPYDFFQDTDYWVVANYAPGWGWYVNVSDATNSVVTSVESEAKIIIVENTLIVLIPRSEFLAQNIGYRVTAYKHPGDWGMTSGDWDGDVQPPVADGLKWVDIGPE